MWDDTILPRLPLRGDFLSFKACIRIGTSAETALRREMRGIPLPHLRQPSHLRCAVCMTLSYLVQVDDTIFILQCPPALNFC